MYIHTTTYINSVELATYDADRAHNDHIYALGAYNDVH